MLLPARTPVAARESPLPSNAAALNPSTPSPLIAATAPKDSSRSYRMLFAAGAVLLGVALGLVFLSLRRLRQARQPSIISRSMEQK